MAAQLLIATTEVLAAYSTLEIIVATPFFTVFLLLVASLIVAVVHELGHAVVGTLLGFRLHQFSVGTGRTIASANVAGVSFRVRAVLLGGGFVVALTDRPRLYRLRSTIFLLAGVVAPLALCLATRDIAATHRVTAVLWGPVLFTSVISAISNLLPRELAEGGISDGKRVLLTWRMTRADVIQATNRTEQDLNTFEFDDLLTDGAASGTDRAALEQLEEAGRRAAEFDPDSWLAHHQAAIGLLVAGKYHEALPLAERALTLGDVSNEPTLRTRAALLNNVACALTVVGDPTTAHRALELSDKAHLLAPSLPLGGTRGACLLLTGDVEEGERLIREALPEIRRPAERFEYLRFLTIAALERRDAFAARRAFGEAVAIASANGLDAERLLALRPRLGAAEAVLWLRRLDEQFLPTADDLGTDGPIIADALLAWIDPKHDNATRWNDFEAQGGHVAPITEDRLQGLLSFGQSLVADRQQATPTPRTVETTEPAHS